MHVVYLILSRYAQHFRNFFKSQLFRTNLWDFKVSDFWFWKRRVASGPNPKIPHFAIGFLEIPRLQCNPVLEGKRII